MQTWFSPLHVETKNEMLKTRCVQINEKPYKFAIYNIMSKKNYHIILNTSMRIWPELKYVHFECFKCVAQKSFIIYNIFNNNIYDVNIEMLIAQQKIFPHASPMYITRSHLFSIVVVERMHHCWL